MCRLTKKILIYYGKHEGHMNFLAILLKLINHFKTS